MVNMQTAVNIYNIYGSSTGGLLNLVPKDKHSVMTAGRPSGMAATPNATATFV